jgi:hypothetical protein
VRARGSLEFVGVHCNPGRTYRRIPCTNRHFCTECAYTFSDGSSRSDTKGGHGELSIPQIAQNGRVDRWVSGCLVACAADRQKWQRSKLSPEHSLTVVKTLHVRAETGGPPRPPPFAPVAWRTYLWPYELTPLPLPAALA